MSWFSPKPLLIPDILRQNQAFLASKPAVIVDDHVTSWSEFGAGTARFANALHATGLKQGDRVVVLMNNSYEMVEAMFGIIRAGLVAVPLNVSIADEAITGMIRNAEAKAVLASGTHVHRVEQLRSAVVDQVGERFITPDSNVEGWLDYIAIRDAAADTLRPINIAPGDECNIIYSSGTTGLPKGIVHDHAGREAWGSDMAVALRYHAGARNL